MALNSSTAFFPGSWGLAGGGVGVGGFSLRLIVTGSFDKGSSFLLFFRPLWVGIRIYGDGTMQIEHLSWEFLYFKEISEEHEILLICTIV